LSHYLQKRTVGTIMSILEVTSTKPRADSLLGFGYGLMGKSIVVTAIDENGIFGQTDLRSGQEIININGVHIQNANRNEVRSLIASLPSGEVTIIVKSNMPTEGVTFTYTTITDHTGIRVKAGMKTPINDPPNVMKDASVPQGKWLLIHTLISNELMPISLKCIVSNTQYNRDMTQYLKVQRSNHTNVKLEQEIHMKGVQTGILHNNVTLVAMAVKDRVNTILAKYHIGAVLAYESIKLPQYKQGQKMENHMMVAIGLNFYEMDYLTVSASAMAMESPGEATVVAVAMPPSAPPLDEGIDTGDLLVGFNDDGGR
jgi:hypothetical protein